MRGTPETRFFSRVIKQFALTECWLWTGKTDSSGYGSFWFEGRFIGAHRYSYTLLVGPIPEGMQLDHLCRLPRCVNPRHLEVVTTAENTRRGDSGINWRRKTHCARGHPFNEENTYHEPRSVHRRCRTCDAERSKARRIGGPSLCAVNTAKTHCVNGHPFDEENTHIHIYKGIAHRHCRACGKVRSKRAWAARKNRKPTDAAPLREGEG